MACRDIGTRLISWGDCRLKEEDILSDLLSWIECPNNSLNLMDKIYKLSERLCTFNY